MKKTMFTMGVILPLLVSSCAKNDPVVPKQTSQNSSHSTSHLARLNGYGIIGECEQMNINGGPKDPDCIPGEEYCQSVVITAPRVPAFIDAVNHGTEDIWLSDNGNYNWLVSEFPRFQPIFDRVISGELSMVLSSMPNKPNKKVVLVGSGTVSQNNYVLAMIFE